jgi:hypothetical protein
VRISIMAGGSSSRPDTLMQTGSAANLDKPPCRRGGPYVFERLDDPLVLSRMSGRALMWEKPSLLRSFPT